MRGGGGGRRDLVRTGDLGAVERWDGRRERGKPSATQLEVIVDEETAVRGGLYRPICGKGEMTTATKCDRESGKFVASGLQSSDVFLTVRISVQSSGRSRLGCPFWLLLCT